MTDSLEPQEEGLLISTGDEDRGFANIFFWYVARPRSIGRSEHLYFHRPFVHGESVLVLTGPDRLEGTFSARQALWELFPPFKIYDDTPSLERVISHAGSLMGTVESLSLSGNGTGIPYVSDLVRIANGNLEKIAKADSAITNMVSHNGMLYTLESARNEGILPGQKVWVWEGLEKEELYQHPEFQYAYSMAVHDGSLFLGGVARLSKISLSSGEAEDVFLDREAALDYSRLVDICDARWDREPKNVHFSAEVPETSYVTRAYKRGFKYERERLDDVIESINHGWYQNLHDDIGYHYQKNFLVEHMASFQGQLLYSQGKNLYVLGREAPVWRFRHRVSGITAVPMELLKELKGRADVRIGKKSRKGVALGLAA